jgi:environmental stress-induced protein Ves
MTSGIEIVRFASRPPKPWANGGGSTRVLVDDADEGREWTYRVSVADLSGYQPFSRFEGIERHLTFLGPGSLRMTVNGIERTLDRWQEIRFLGEDAVASEPSEPTARDLNVMVRRSARTVTVTPTAGVSIISPQAGSATIWIALEPYAVLEKQRVSELDLAVIGGSSPVTVDGKGILCEIRTRESV